jgi:hypothetical protein
MSRRFYSAKADCSDHVQLYEVADNTIFVLNGSARTGIQKIRDDDPIPSLRRHAASHFGSSAELTVEEVPIAPGVYHPSVARPTFQNPTMPINVELNWQIDESRKVERELEILIEELEACFQVASPDQRNLGVFGARFERIILLSCIGIEALLSKVLRDNNIPPKGKFYTTKDFVVLDRFLRLSDYAIEFPKYPWMAAREPFRGWQANEPSRSLLWYDAYNKLKHEKLSSSEMASMRHSLDCVSAYTALFVAVFGDGGRQIIGGVDLSYFGVARRPRWSLSEVYFEPGDANWRAVNLQL